jgi:hypothetical protein
MTFGRQEQNNQQTGGGMQAAQTAFQGGRANKLQPTA